MIIQIIQVPYDSGHKGIRTGRGPNHFIEHGIDLMLRDWGHDVDVCQIEVGVSLPTEIGTGFELNRLLAMSVGSAVSNTRFPLVSKYESKHNHRLEPSPKKALFFGIVFVGGSARWGVGSKK